MYSRARNWSFLLAVLPKSEGRRSEMLFVKHGVEVAAKLLVLPRFAVMMSGLSFVDESRLEQGNLITRENN